MTKIKSLIANTEVVTKAALEAARATKPVVFNPAVRVAKAGCSAMWVEVAKVAISEMSVALKDGPTQRLAVTVYGIVGAANGVGAEIDVADDLSNAYNAMHDALAFAPNAAEEIAKDIAEAIGYFGDAQTEARL